MNTGGAERGAELVSGGQSVGFGPGWLARLWAGRVDRIIARLNKGLVHGKLNAVLPDGRAITLGGRGAGAEAQIHLHEWRGLLRFVTAGSVGVYQGWEAGDWSSRDPVSLFALFVENAAALGDTGRAHGPWKLAARLAHWLHRNTRAGSARNIHAHYDLGNDFYAAWLDPSMTYSSALFAAGDMDLERGQQHKVQAAGQRIAGAQTVLEIGCGWGTLSGYLADQGMAVTAISLSDEQLAWAGERQDGKAIEFRKQDYRDVAGQFDAIVSVEMVEAVGREYWPHFFDCIARCLKPGGKAAIQYICIRDELFEAYARNADFIQTYIFPGGMLISESTFRKLAAERGLAWCDQVDFGQDYAETLKLWRERFDRAVAEGRLPAGFDERFVRLWRFYLIYCEGGFRGGGINVAQVTLQKSGGKNQASER